MMKFKLVLALLALTASSIEARQDAASKPAAFEVASMKANKELGPIGDQPRNMDTSPGRFTMRDVPLRYILEWAYDLRDYEIAGPEWITADDRFDITAKASGPATDEEMRPMVQALLTDRLQMKVHRETRDLSVYVLLPGKGPAKVREPAPEGASAISRTESGATLFHRFPLSRLTFLLTRRMDRPVIDLTGLNGIYDFSLDLSGLGFNGQPPADPTAGPSIFTAVENDMGLKLEGRKHPVQILVVDHAERVPRDSGN